jgi:hypothetical protein
VDALATKTHKITKNIENPPISINQSMFASFWDLFTLPQAFFVFVVCCAINLFATSLFFIESLRTIG